MEKKPLRPNLAIALIAFAILFAVMLACARLVQGQESPVWSVSGPAVDSPDSPVGRPVGEALTLAETPAANSPLYTPTPDPPHAIPPMRSEPEVHFVQAGETLNAIAQRYSVSLELLVRENELANPNLLEIGQKLNVPLPTPKGIAPGFKVIPDSELVFGPTADGFDVQEFVQSQNGYLAYYTEEVDELGLSGAQIVERVARDYSVHPRLLLAVLEERSGWVSQRNPADETLDFPIGIRDDWRKGLYRQLAWAANQLNRGFYMWRVNGVAVWLLPDNSVVPVNPTVNAGTAGVQHFYSQLLGLANWEQAVGEGGLFQVYSRFFGNPFRYTVEPLVPPGIQQPAMQLPFESGKEWAFTGGPHGGWGDGSAWAALDFAPPSEALGCVQSDEWVVAVADGMILRAGSGAVIQDLDEPNGEPNDGLEGTGWLALYMHIETRDRVSPGTYLRAGERIGHPSCEGGVSSGTHVHLARRYNGEWISADQDLPFNLDGWFSSGDGFEYNGFLQNGGVSIEAYAGREPENLISR